jgi:hypothetical protein
MDDLKQPEKGQKVLQEFPPLEPFGTLFPQIKHVSVEVTESDCRKVDRPLIYACTEASYVEKLACHRNDCLDGGVRLGSILRKMIPDRIVDLVELISCDGHEKPRQDQEQAEPCQTKFTIKVHIVYKDKKTMGGFILGS